MRCGGPTRAIAQKKLAEIEKLLWDGVSLVDAFDRVCGRKGGEGVSFTDVVPRFLERYAKIELKPSSHIDYRRRLAVLARAHWASRPMRSVTTRDLEAWKEERLGEGVAVTTVNRDLSSIPSLWGWARRTGLVNENPAAGVQRYSEAGRAREVRLSVAESRALIAACAACIRPIVICAVHTGMRRGEILSLAWDAVDFEAGHWSQECMSQLRDTWGIGARNACRNFVTHGAWLLLNAVRRTDALLALGSDELVAAVSPSSDESSWLRTPPVADTAMR